jgi:hypothetical protein
LWGFIHDQGTDAKQMMPQKPEAFLRQALTNRQGRA